MKRTLALAIAALVLLVTVTGGGLGARSPAVVRPSTSTVVDVGINTQFGFSFTPDKVSVRVGDTVDLLITQDDTTQHTFTLSSVVNYTIPSSTTPSELYAFFNAHPPLVNLSLPATVGYEAYSNFSAPPLGTYEYVCEIPDHFQAGMYGFFEVLNQTAPLTNNSGTPSPLELGAIGAVVVILVAGGLFAWRRSRRKPREPAETAPPANAEPPK
ncbi:MAG: cupredoxin domain-containing protein [Thermoplasmata archaeon]